MKKPSLIVLSNSSHSPIQKKITRSGLSQKKVETKAIFDRKWLQNPFQFQIQGSIDKERLRLSKIAINQHTHKESSILDIGCGFGDLSLYCSNKGMSVSACEVSQNALPHLNQLKKENIHLTIDQLPFTKFKDSSFDALLCTETIGELSPREYRLTFSELARILKIKGLVICSTSFESSSFLPHLGFLKLAETEFQTKAIYLSYHYIFESFLKALNYFKLTRPLHYFFKNNRITMRALELVTKFLLGEKGITHIIYVGVKKSLF